MSLAGNAQSYVFFSKPPDLLFQGGYSKPLCHSFLYSLEQRQTIHYNWDVLLLAVNKNHSRKTVSSRNTGKVYLKYKC